jgi:hypothetical protein
MAPKKSETYRIGRSDANTSTVIFELSPLSPSVHIFLSSDSAHVLLLARLLLRICSTQKMAAECSSEHSATRHLHNYSLENYKSKGTVNSFYIRKFFLTIFSFPWIHIPWVTIFLQKISITNKKKINKRNTGRDKPREKRSTKIYF